MLNKFLVIGLVRSAPVYLEAHNRKGKFAKFTILNESDIPWVIKKDLEKEKRGDVYFDCLAPCDKGKNPGKYALKRVHNGDTVSISGRIMAGKKPVVDETTGYRTNWVYGDYLYIFVEELEVVRTEKERFKNPYVPKYNDGNRADTQKRYYPNQIVSESDQIDDEDIKFNLEGD